MLIFFPPRGLGPAPFLAASTRTTLAPTRPDDLDDDDDDDGNRTAAGTKLLPCVVVTRAVAALPLNAAVDDLLASASIGGR